MRIEEEILISKFRNGTHRATVNMLFTAHWLKERINKSLKPFGLKNEQYNVLRILRGKFPEPMCVKDIASRTIFRNSNIPRILDRLVSKKLVQREQSQIDKRETLATVTTKGLDVLAKLDVLMDQNEKKLFNLTEEEAYQLSIILDKMRDTK